MATDAPRVTMGVIVGTGLVGAEGTERGLEGEVETRWSRGTLRPWETAMDKARVRSLEVVMVTVSLSASTKVSFRVNVLGRENASLAAEVRVAGLEEEGTKRTSSPYLILILEIPATGVSDMRASGV